VAQKIERQKTSDKRSPYCNPALVTSGTADAGMWNYEPRAWLFGQEKNKYSIDASMPWSKEEEVASGVMWQFSEVRNCAPAGVGQKIESFFDYGFVRFKNTNSCAVSGVITLTAVDMERGNKIDNKFTVHLEPGELWQSIGLWYLGCTVRGHSYELREYPPLK
jgi:hypothetical protein